VVEINEEISVHNNQTKEQIYDFPIAYMTFPLMPEDFSLCNAEGEETFYDSIESSYTGDLDVVNEFMTMKTIWCM